MADSQPARRRRLSPGDRRNQLLDSAASVVATRGLSNLTMELVAEEAGVSNPLIYKYFPNRQALLQALLERALAIYAESVERQLEGVTDYEGIVRVFVTTNFDQFERGSVINTLLSEPELRRAAGAAEGKRAGKYLVRLLTKRYGLSPKRAERLVVLGAGASQAAAQRYAGTSLDREAIIDETTRFILAGTEALLTPS